MSDNEKQGSGVLGGAVGVAAGAGVVHFGTKAATSSAVSRALEGTEEVFKEGGKQAAFKTAVDGVAKEAAGDVAKGVTGTSFAEKFASASADLAKKGQKLEGGAEAISADALKAAKTGKAEVIGAVKKGLKGVEGGSLVKNIKGTHLAGIAVGTLAAAYAGKKIADKAFGGTSHAAKIEAERASAPAQAAGRA